MLESARYDPVLLRKAQVIERCVARAREELQNAQGNFAQDFTRQDAAILNLQRACEASLDMAQRVIATKKWGVAESAKDTFLILQRQQIISDALCKTLSNMVGFRNIAVHAYEALDCAIVTRIITHDCEDLLAFSQQLMQQFFESQA